jgi:iron transport multicopper oxidase
MFITYLTLFYALFVYQGVSAIVTQSHGNTRINWYGNTGVNLSNTASKTKIIEKYLGPYQFFAQPLVHKNLVFAASINNTIFQINALTGKVNKQKTVDIPFNANRDFEGSCVPESNPWTGILSTPVLDANIIYFTSKTYKAGTTSGIDNSVWKLHAIDFNTWQPLTGFPVIIEGSYKDVTFNGGEQLQRPGLLSLNGRIVIAFGAYCSLFDYHGWVFTVNKISGAIETVFATSTTDPSSRGGGIWMSGSSPSSRNDGTFYLTTGNSFGNDEYDTAVRGADAITTPLVNSVIRFSITTGQPIDFFTPSDTVYLDSVGKDLGLGTLSLLPAEFNYAGKKTGVTLGKDGRMFTVNTGDLGGFAGRNTSDNVIETLQVGGGSRCTPSAFPPDKMIYISVFNKGIQAFQISPTTGKFVYVGKTVSNIGTNVGSVAVTSSSRQLGSASIWINDVNTARIRAYKGTPVNGILEEILAVEAKVCKFTTPTFYGNRVYVTTCDGRLIVLG